MPATNNLESELLNLLFLNNAIANMGDASGVLPSATAGVFYISLHEGNLSDVNDDQANLETNYTGYSRQSVARTAGGWSLGGSTSVSNVAAISFGESSDGPHSITDFGLGHASTGTAANSLWIYGQLSSTLVINAGITPEFASSSLQISVD